MDDDDLQRFSDFVRSRTPVLIRVAYLLCGEQHAAEDLLQTALAKTAAKWKQLRAADPEPYVRKVMYREQVSRWRKGWHREVPVQAPPEQASSDPSATSDLRLAMQQALLRLPPRQRLVIVLRYYEDLTETQVAEALGCSVGTVRSRTGRAIDKLRAAMPELDHEGVLSGGRP